MSPSPFSSRRSGGGALGFTADRVILRDRISRPKVVGLRSPIDFNSTPHSVSGWIPSPTICTSGTTSSVDRRPALDSLKQRTRDEIRAMLTPTHLADFEKLLAR